MAELCPFKVGAKVASWPTLGRKLATLAIFFAKSIFTSILKVSDKFMIKCSRSRLFGDWHLGKMGFWDIWPFLCFLESKMVNLGLIDFQLGLSLNINGNNGQYKFEVHISKNMAKMANFRPKVGQDATFAPTLNGHNSASFYLILSFDHTKKLSSISAC